MLANGLTFGSFDSSFVKEASSDNCSIGCDDSSIVSSPETAACGASARLVTEILQCFLLLCFHDLPYSFSVIYMINLY